MRTELDQMNRLVTNVERLDSFKDALRMIDHRLQCAKAPMILSFVNAHAYNLCHTDQSFKDALLASDVLLRDGAGMSILYYSVQLDPGQNFCGTDFIPFLLRELQPKRIALLGTRDPYLENAALSLRSQGFDVVLTMDGFREPAEYLEQVEATRPDVVLLGMGMPKQEQVSLYLKANLQFPLLAINGGACIDYLGGKVTRAPVWMRRNGLEWVYRLMLEPRRMFRRYVVGNVLFIRRVVALRGAVTSLPLAKELEGYENSSDRVGRGTLD
jgi:exopolysaccharide biosynthesis WecB/TagA/CpsF family protein